MSNFVEISSGRAALLHVEGQTDRQTDRLTGRQAEERTDIRT
jgi:hypothetical protein